MKNIQILTSDNAAQLYAESDAIWRRLGGEKSGLRFSLAMEAGSYEELVFLQTRNEIMDLLPSEAGVFYMVVEKVN